VGSVFPAPTLGRQRAITSWSRLTPIERSPVISPSPKHIARAEHRPRQGVGAETAPPLPSRSQQQPDRDSERHLVAVAGSLRSANESAARGDYRDALGWLAVLEAVGEELPTAYIAKRQLWLSAFADAEEEWGANAHQQTA
jgi:hypothetical protein